MDDESLLELRDAFKSGENELLSSARHREETGNENGT